MWVVLVFTILCSENGTKVNSVICVHAHERLSRDPWRNFLYSFSAYAGERGKPEGGRGGMTRKARSLAANVEIMGRR